MATLPLLVASIILVGVGVLVAWRIYQPGRVEEQFADPMEVRWGRVFRALREGLYVDALYDATVVAWTQLLGHISAALDRSIWSGFAALPAALVRRISGLVDRIDRRAINRGFERACRGLLKSGTGVQHLHHGNLQSFLTSLGVGVLILLLVLALL